MEHETANPLKPWKQEICAVIITYNPDEKLVSLLKKLKNQVDHVILIDNATSNEHIEHIETALKNGFSLTATGAPIVIADGINGEDYVEVEVNGSYFKKVKIAGEAYRASAMVVLSHFKGHEMFGFGGAMKNIGMGLACKKGKLSLHSTSKPVIKAKTCVRCGICSTWCPAGALELTEESMVINEKLTTTDFKPFRPLLANA